MKIYYVQYRFKKDDLSKINTIAIYNKYLWITNLNGDELAKPFHCSELPRVLKNSKAERFELSCYSTNEESTADIFPKINKTIEFSALVGVDKATLLSTVQKELDLIKQGFLAHMHGAEVKLEPIGKITQLQALVILDVLKNEFDLTGTMHFSKLETILFQHHGSNHWLSYGENSSYENGLSHLRFNINDGFAFTKPAIQKELQSYFKKWEANNFQGALIPYENSGFFESMPAKPLSSFLKRLMMSASSNMGDVRSGYNFSSAAAASSPCENFEEHAVTVPDWVTSSPIPNLSSALNVEEDSLDTLTAELMLAIEQRLPKLVLKHIQEGARVNTIIIREVGKKSQYAITPLASAVFNLDYKSTKILLMNYANPNLEYCGKVTIRRINSRHGEY